MDTPPRDRNRRYRVMESPAHRLQTLVIDYHSELGRLANTDLEDVMDIEVWIIVEEDLEAFVEEAKNQLNAQPHDRLGVRIEGQLENGERVIIGIPWVEVPQMTAAHIMEQINEWLQSYQVLLLDHLEFTFTVRHMQAHNIQGVSYRGVMTQFVNNKQSMVTINPPTDHVNGNENCWYQWIAIGLAHLIEQGLLDAFEPLTLHSYRMMIKSGKKFKKRKQIAEWVKAQCPQAVPHQISTWVHVEQRFGVRLACWGWKRQHFQLQYPDPNLLPFTDTLPVICGLLHMNEDEEWSHVDYVSKSHQILSRDKNKILHTCPHCFEIYSHRTICSFEGCSTSGWLNCVACHTCTGVCDACHEKPCRQSQSELFKYCNQCNLATFSPDCHRKHFMLCKKQFQKMCEQCDRPEHPMRTCTQTFCKRCSSVYEQVEDHICFLRRPGLKKPTTNFVVYDFECALNNDKIHVPYLCTVWFPYGHDSLEYFMDHFPYQLIDSIQGPVFCFWGLGNAEQETGVYECFKMMSDANMDGTIWFAHNAKAYDSILIKHHFASVRHLFSKDITRGQKLIEMHYEMLNVRFRDSISFIPTALRNMSTEFGIEEFKKGHFPHSIVTTSYLQEAETKAWCMPLPQPDDFPTQWAIGKKGDKQRIEFETWYQGWIEANECFQVKQDAIDYCISDTVLLGKTLVIFREQLMEMTRHIPRAVVREQQKELDPLAYLTLPSAMMAFFLSEIMPDETIAIIDSNHQHILRLREEWLLWCEHSESIILERNMEIDGYTLDGYFEERVFLFFCCLDTGCSQCTKNHNIHPIQNIPFSELRTQHMLKMRHLLQLFPNTTCIQECEWNRLSKSANVKQWKSLYNARIQETLPMQPRDAYKGGKVEVYKIAYKDTISMVDFVSQYPTTMLGESHDPFSEEMIKWPMPKGFPKQMYRPFQYVLSDKLGVAKIRVLAPQDLYAPFLSARVPSRRNPSSYEVIYGNCFTCMTFRSPQCNHEESLREFTGTWTLSEIRYAVELGYCVKEWIDVWEYQDQDDYLFRTFIVPFMKNKICAKRDGIVVDMDNTSEWTDQGERVAAYLEELTGTVVQKEEFENAPAKRFVAKLAMNSFTGKWGQAEVHRSSRTFDKTQAKESNALFDDSRYTILGAQVLSEQDEIIVVEYEDRLGATSAFQRKNDIIIAYITCYGRIMLHRLEMKLGRNLLYVDTDSAFHKFMDEPPYRSGFRTGDLEQELPLASNWVACGRKSYVYQKMQNANQPAEYVPKQKGLTLKHHIANKFTSEALLALIQNTVQCCVDGEDVHVTKKRREANQAECFIEAEQTLFETVHSKLSYQKRTRTFLKKTMFAIEAMKRIPLWPTAWETVDQIDTVPYGYVEPARLEIE